MNHFDTIADNFDGLWQMTPEYQRWMTDNIVSLLNLEASDTLVDLGGGTGLYSKLILNTIQMDREVLCVDSSAEMLEQINSEHIQPVHCCADSFHDAPRQYSKILMKEMVHFVLNRTELFARIAGVLPSSGVALVVTRPKETSLPFFDLARKTFADSQPHEKDLKLEIEASGLVCEVVKKDFTFLLPKETWYKMLRERYMSNLSKISSFDMEEGIAELEKRHEGKEKISVCDSILFVVAKHSQIQ